MSKKKARVSDADKVKILKRHLLEKVPVSELCDENGIAPSVYYNWQTKLFDNAEEALRTSQKQRTITKVSALTLFSRLSRDHPLAGGARHCIHIAQC